MRSGFSWSRRPSVSTSPVTMASAAASKIASGEAGAVSASTCGGNVAQLSNAFARAMEDRAVASTVIVSGAQTIFAESPRKEIWDWTLDERLAKRFDPADVRARNRVEVEAHGEAARASAMSGSGREMRSVPVMEYNIDGRRNPELFLP